MARRSESARRAQTPAGAGASLVTVKPTSLTADANGARSILTIGGGADVEVSGFTFRGPVPEITAGIFVRDGANANIHDNKVIDARESVTISGNQRGIGIFVGRALFGTTGTATITNNTITGYQKGGIVVDGAGSQATITGNTVVGEGPTVALAQNGIQVSNGAGGTVQGKPKRWNSIYARVLETVGLEINGTQVGTRDPADLLGVAPGAETGDLRADTMGIDGDAKITIRQNLPFPATVLAIIGELAVGD